MVTLMFKVWGIDVLYGMNHMIQGLSNDMEGGMKHYLGASRDYGSGFMETIMGSNLVYLMLVGKRDSLPLRLGSRSMCIAFDIWGFIVWLCTEVWPWRRPTTCEGMPARTHNSIP